jgi:hypothetical protein
MFVIYLKCRGLALRGSLFGPASPSGSFLSGSSVNQRLLVQKSKYTWGMNYVLAERKVYEYERLGRAKRFTQSSTDLRY